METIKTITAKERAERTRRTIPLPIAQFRVKGGCRTCKPIPVYPRSTIHLPNATQTPNPS